MSLAKIMMRMFTEVNIIESPLAKSVKRKKVFIPHDKRIYTFLQNWLAEEPNKLYNQIKRFMNPGDNRYQKVH